MLPIHYWLTIPIIAFVVILCVALHYETLRLLSDKLPMPKHHHRRRIIILILSLLLLHTAEIWIFGATYRVLLLQGDFGSLIGMAGDGILNCIYYSASVYTTLGFGDIIPTGPLQFITGTEALAGLTFITWSASYTFLEMLKTWDHGGDA
jgi:hypothetical protein